MLRVDLGQLRREGSVLVQARVPPDDGLWRDSGLTWVGDVGVKLMAALAGTGEVVVRGRIDGTLDHECRRCLRPVGTSVGVDVTLVLVENAGEAESDDSDAYVFEPGAELDLSNAVREEVILATNPYVVCDPGCQGLCATCGTNLNEAVCDCTEDETDPRWDALRALKNE